MSFTPFAMPVTAPDLRPEQGIPRWVEAIAGAMALLLLAPLVCVCALLVAAGSGRPVLHKQLRAGRSGRPFTLYKFRTMCPSNAGAQVTASDDVRVTRVGRVLRRLKWDELPQFWNVVKGDMALVGPRPEALVYVDLREPRWRQVLAVRPGLTDPVTIALRNEESLLAAVDGDRDEFYRRTLQPFKLRGYIEYLQRRSWRTDMRVLRDTVVTVLRPGRAPLITIDDVTGAPEAEQP
jgi:lipopolysaccharide/colanic/teichoic acid biosynthesis glycosyltransferase